MRSSASSTNCSKRTSWVKGKVLESAMLTPRTVSEALCEAAGAEPVQCIGSKFILYRQARDKDKRKIVLVK